MRYMTAAALHKLSDVLNLDDDGVQDWDIELADPNRIQEFMNLYKSLQDDDEKFALLALIVASYDDFIYKNGRSNEIEQFLSSVLQHEWEIHRDTIFRWTLIDSESIDGFNVTPWAREVCNKNA